jgi:hypothetical protein
MVEIGDKPILWHIMKQPSMTTVAPSWTVHLVDTGLHTQTGGRLKRLAKWRQGEGTACFT